MTWTEGQKPTTSRTMGFGALTLLLGVSLPAAALDSDALMRLIGSVPKLLPVSEPIFLVLFGSALAFTAWGARRGHARRRTE
jgi:hypothetical protein